MQFDVVIPLGKGSKLGNAELRYSLRSLIAHGTNLGRVFVIGEKPEFLNWGDRLIHIPFTETQRRYANVWEKLLAASRDERISERFLFTNDDIYVLEKFDAGDVPYYVRNRRLDQMPSARMKFEEIPTDYRKMMRKTLEALKERGMTAFHFGTHQPVNFEKAKVASTYEEFSRDLYTHWGLSFRCCYGNQHRVEHVARPTVVLKTVVPSRKFKKFAVSSHQDLEKTELMTWLENTYPVRTEFER